MNLVNLIPRATDKNHLLCHMKHVSSWSHIDGLKIVSPESHVSTVRNAKLVRAQPSCSLDRAAQHRDVTHAVLQEYQAQHAR